MTYAVKEIFYTLQGEGANAGCPAVFCRFAGCNLWSGREEDRATAVCRFCDTDFVGTDGTGGGKPLDWDGVRSWKPEDGTLWVHLDHADPPARQWLEEESGVTPLMVQALFADETRPRLSSGV